jgi:hypothetical protein
MARIRFLDGGPPLQSPTLDRLSGEMAAGQGIWSADPMAPPPAAPVPPAPPPPVAPAASRLSRIVAEPPVLPGGTEFGAPFEPPIPMPAAPAATGYTPGGWDDPDVNQADRRFYEGTTRLERITAPLTAGFYQLRQGGQVAGSMVAAGHQRRLGGLPTVPPEADVPDGVPPEMVARAQRLGQGRFYMPPEIKADGMANAEAALTASAEGIAGLQGRIDALPQNPAVRDMLGARTFAEAGAAFWRDPIGAIQSIGLQSLPLSAAGIVGGIVGGPAVGALTMGANSAGTEYLSSILEGLTENGIDPRNPEALAAAFRDPAIMEAVRQKAALRAGIIGTVDAATMGLAGRTLAPAAIGNRLVREAVNIPAQIAAQGVAGAGGEAVAQLATDGAITKPGQVLAEAAGEAFGAPGEVAGLAANRMLSGGGAGRISQIEAGAPPPSAPQRITPVFGQPPEVAPPTPAAVGAPQQPVPTPSPAAAAAPPPPAPNVVADVTGQPLGQVGPDGRLVPGVSPPAPGSDTLRTLLADPRPLAEIQAEEQARREAETAARRQEEDRLIAETQAALPPGFVVRRTEGGDAVEMLDPAGDVMRTQTAFSARDAEVARQEAAQLEAEVDYSEFRREGTGTRDDPVVVQTGSDVDAAASQAADPTPAQAAAGNYRMGHAVVQGFDVAIETPRGGTRAGVDPDGKPWSVVMPAHYGYLKGGKGADGDKLDVYIGPTPDAPEVFVVDQIDPATGKFDEHKILMGFPDQASALAAYDAAFSDGSGPNRRGAVTPMDTAQLRVWVGYSDTTKPLAYQEPQPPAPAPQSPEGRGQLDLLGRSPRREEAATVTERANSLLMDLRADGMDDDAIRSLLTDEVNFGIPEARARVNRRALAILRATASAARRQEASRRTAYEAARSSPPPPSAPTPAAPRTEPPAAAADGARGIAGSFADAFATGRRFASIAQARQYAATLGVQARPGTPEAKQVDEAIEVGVVMAARRIVEEDRAAGRRPQETFGRLVDLYGRQPKLSVRTSGSIERQAYSTPAPLAWVASQLAGIGPQTLVYEPTAGNGALLIGADPERVQANEIDADRRAALKQQGIGGLTGLDASDPRSVRQFEGLTDAVIANPPFGIVKDDDGQTRRFDMGGGYETGEIDHAISLTALRAMKDDGRAVLIIGGLNKQIQNPQGRADAYNAKAKREFFFTLYRAYNVVDHFTVAGELYERQGAGWPVDVIVIDGRGRSELRLPSQGAPRQLSTWEQVGEAMNGRPDEGRGGAGDGVVAAPGQRSAGDVDGRPGDGRAPEGRGPDGGVSRPAGPAAGVAGQPGAVGGRGDAPGGGDVRPARPDGRSVPTDQRPRDGDGSGPGEPGVPGADQPAGGPAGRPADAGEGDPAGTSPRPADGSRPVARGAGGDAVDDGVDDAITAALDAEFGGPAPPPDGTPGRADAGAEGPGETPAPSDSGTRRRTAAQAGASAVANFAGTADDAMAALVQLFGGGRTIGSGPVFDDETYARARPLFAAAIQKFRAGAADVAEMARELVRELASSFQMAREAIEAMRPYLARFIREVRDGVISLGQPRSEAPDVGRVSEDTTPRADAAPAARRKVDRTKLEPEEKQVAYRPKSEGTSVDTLVPRNMETAIRESLDALGERVGPIDRFVGDRLGYEPDKLSEAFSAEQIDAIALAIDNIDAGAGFVIGDQTGIGKGRVVAAMIRYAMRRGLVPVFVTEKPNLYADMHRDLTDIGMSGIRILMTNNGLTVPLGEGEALKTPPKAKHEATLRQVADAARSRRGLGGDHDVVFTTYSQMQTQRGEVTSRMQFLRDVASGGFLILDESHNAGGSGKSEGEDDTLDRAAFTRELVDRAASVFYSSATYAKRPSVMSLYSKTDMRLAVDGDDLAEAIQRGGVPLQQVVAAMLAKAGQYIRRERSFAGVTYDSPVVPVSRETYDRFSRILAAVLRFEVEFIKPTVKGIDRVVRADARRVTTDNSTGGAGAESTNFTAVMHNLIDQMLLAIKAKPAVEQAIAALRAGEKPVITVANTMGSFIEDYVEQVGLAPGDAINIDFGSLLTRYLERTRWYTERPPFMRRGEKGIRRYIDDDQLGPDGVAAFERVRQMIADTDLSELPVSPIDFIRAELARAGYKVGEITGRSATIEYRADGRGYYRVRGGAETSIQGRLTAISGFNSGDLDAMILNQSGATGLSLHASVKFTDRRRRRMIIAQAEKNIDTHMQMLGRVHRTGQVVTPSYVQMVADVPAEKRPAAVLSKKMASLNASTTASREGALTAKDVPDFMNEYGDEVAAAVMNDNPDLHQALGEPLKAEEEGYVQEDAMRKVTGRIPLLPLQQQEDLYSMLEEEYLALIEEKDAAGENALEAKLVDLDARTLSSMEIVPARETTRSASPFAASARVETVDVRRLRRPPTSAAVVRMVADSLGEEVPTGSPLAALTKLTRDTVDRRAVQEEFRRYQREVLDEIEDDRVRNAQQDRLNAQAGRLRTILDMAPVGQTVRMMTDAGNVYGVVIDVKRTGKARNPVALGSWKVTVMQTDGVRRNLPVSRLYTRDNQPAEPVAGDIIIERAETFAGAPVLDAFDDMQADRREERHIVTGNLLSGFAGVDGRGSIVNYTDADGEIRQGILMPSAWDLETFRAEQATRFTRVEQVIEFLATPGREVRTNDGHLTVVASQGGQFAMQAASSRADGGRYFLSRPLRDAAGGDFVRVGDRMVVSFGRSQLERVVGLIMDMPRTQMISNDPEARQIVNPVAEIRVGRRADRDGPATVDPAAVERLVALVERMGGGRVRLQWTGDRLFNAAGEEIGGAALENLIRVTFAHGEGNAEGFARHELIHALRRMGFFTDDEWASLVQAAETWRRDYDIDARYPDVSEERKVEEAIAHAFGRNAAGARTGVVAAFQRIREFLRRFWRILTSNGFRNAEAVFRRVESGEIGARGPTRAPRGSDTEIDARMDARVGPVGRLADRIRDFVVRARDVVGETVRFKIGDVTKENAAMVRAATGLDISGYVREIDNSAIRHAFNQHGPSKETRGGQVPITAEDMAMIPEIVRNPDGIRHGGKSKIGRDVIVYKKNVGAMMFYVEEVRTGRKTVALQTFYKYPSNYKEKVDASDVPASLPDGRASGLELSRSETDPFTSTLRKTSSDNVSETPPARNLDDVIDDPAEMRLALRSAATAGKRVKDIADKIWNGAPPPPELTIAEPAAVRDMNLLKRWFATPEAAFRKWPALARLVDRGVEGEIKQSVWINRLNERYDRIRGGLSKAGGDFNKVTAALWSADADQVDFTDAAAIGEVFDAHDLTAAERAAAMKVARLIEAQGRLVDQHRRAMLPQVRTRKAKVWQAMQRLVRGARVMADEEFATLYRRRAYLSARIRSGDALPGDHADEIRRINDRLMSIRMADPEVQAEMTRLQGEYDALELRLQEVSVRRRKGYVPHKFFGSWRLWRQDGEDDDGNPVWRELTSDQGFYDTKADAIEAARKHLAQHPGDTLKAEPKQTRWPSDDGSTVLTDAAYRRFVEKLSETAAVEGDELKDMVKGVARLRARRRLYNPGRFRSGAAGWSRDIDRVMRTHIAQAIRYVVMDRLKFDMVTAQERMGLSPQKVVTQERPVLQAALDAWWRDVNGSKQSLESQLDSLIDAMGPSKSALSLGGLGFTVGGGFVNPVFGAALGGYLGFRMWRAAAKGGAFPSRTLAGDMLTDMAHLKLGMLVNVASAAVNLTQVLLNAYPVLGERWTAVGYKRAAKALFDAARGRRTADVVLLERADIRSRYSFAENQPGLSEVQSRAAKASMFFFQGAETLNRATTLLGAYAKAEAAGMSPGAAFREAQRISRRTQFHYGAAAKPELIRGRDPLTALPAQFKNYLFQQIAFTLSLKAPEVPRFLLAMFLVAGALGLPGAQLLDWLLEKLTGWSPIQATKDAAIDAMAYGETAGTVAAGIARGLPAMFGVDISARTGMGEKFLPSSLSDIQGPWIGTVMQLRELNQAGAGLVDQLRAVTAAAAPLKSLEAAANGIPITSPDRFLEGFGDGRAVFTNPRLRGAAEYEPTDAELGLRAIGLRPIDESRRTDVIDRERRLDLKRQKEVRPYLARIVDAYRAGDMAAIDRIAAEAEQDDVPLTPQQVRRALQDSETMRDERTVKTTQRVLREDIVRRFDLIRQSRGEPAMAGP